VHLPITGLKQSVKHCVTPDDRDVGFEV